ncbi:(Fe-S)-binding protein, partial [Kocuria rosea]
MVRPQAVRCPRIDPFSFFARPRSPVPGGPMRIALFATCIVDAMYPRVALATVRVLERLGHEVVFPPGQGCC